MDKIIDFIFAMFYSDRVICLTEILINFYYKWNLYKLLLTIRKDIF